jgi:hypothetical protein
MNVQYASVETMPVVFPNRPNGGWYNDAESTGAWGSVRVVPDAESMNKGTLNSAHPPPGAGLQPATFVRPGNNAGYARDLVTSYGFVMSPP